MESREVFWCKTNLKQFQIDKIRVDEKEIWRQDKGKNLEEEIEMGN